MDITKKKGHVNVIPFNATKNWFIAISGREVKEGNLCKATMSFLVVHETGLIEWEPNFGPITVVKKYENEEDNTSRHWYYGEPVCNDWTQLAVTERGFDQLFVEGDFEGIFIQM